MGSSPGRAPPLERHDKGSRTRLGLLLFLRSQRLALKNATSPSPSVTDLLSLVSIVLVSNVVMHLAVVSLLKFYFGGGRGFIDN